MAQRVISTKRNIPLKVKLTFNIRRLLASDAFKAPLTKPTCDKDTPPGLVSRTFQYKDGRRCTVTCHAKVMVALLRAMRLAPGIQVTASSDSMYSGSYRSWSQQNTLYQLYTSGNGHLAANPCTGFHRRGRALDLKDVSEKEKQAMLKVSVDGKQFYNGASFGDPAHYSFGVLG